MAFFTIRIIISHIFFSSELSSLHLLLLFLVFFFSWTCKPGLFGSFFPPLLSDRSTFSVLSPIMDQTNSLLTLLSRAITAQLQRVWLFVHFCTVGFHLPFICSFMQDNSERRKGRKEKRKTEFKYTETQRDAKERG